MVLFLAQAILLTIDKGLKFAANYIRENYQTIFLYVIGGLLFGLGFSLFIFQIRRTKQNSDSSLTDDDDDNINDNTTANNLTIYTEGGNYNESIDGDYIEIQGNYININQDFSDVATEIRELIAQLKTQGYSEEHAETIVASELAEQARRKSKVRKKLFKWRKDFRGATAKVNHGNNETEAAREVVKGAVTYRYTSSRSSISVMKRTYYKLDKLLRIKKWKEADQETAKIIYELSSQELQKYSQDYEIALVQYYLSAKSVENICLSYEHIAALPNKDLNTINNLWLKYSNGRFGFSVQKRIWESLKPNSDYDLFGIEDEIKEKFSDIVGWRKKGYWLYYSDMNYSLTAPNGHFPIKVMLNSSLVERCSINNSIFSVFVGREYNKS